MLAPDRRIDIAFGVDANYVPHAAAVIAAMRRNAPGARFRFVMLFDEVDDLTRLEFEAVAPEDEFVWVQLDSSRFSNFKEHEHFTRAILFRLGLAELAPADCKRIIYLDADLIPVDDIRHLWEVDLGGFAMGAVEDCFVDPQAFAGKWLLNSVDASYFNSGVLLIDLEASRAEGLFDRALEFVAQHGSKLRFTDQDALNWAFAGRWLRLPNCWNVQRHMVLPSLILELPAIRRLGHARPAIVHFTGPEKPWLYESYHPWAWLYWQALSETSFFSKVAKAEGINRYRRIRIWLRWVRNRLFAKPYGSANQYSAVSSKGGATE